MKSSKDIKKSIKKFIERTEDWTKEKQYDQEFWRSLIMCYMSGKEIDYTNFDYIDWQFDVIEIDKTGKSHKKWADGYIPSTKVLIEQKSYGESLDEAWVQAKNYYSNLPSGTVNWIVLCDFKTFIVHNMMLPGFPYFEVKTADLINDFDDLSFLVDCEKIENPSKEFKVSKRAGEIVGEIYNAIYDKYPIEIDEEEKLFNLNKLCVRLVFCFYAEDAGLFNAKNQFFNYMKQFPAKDWNLHLTQLFGVLNMPMDDAQRLYLPDDLKAFPYVNGGLFADDVRMPQFTDDTVNLILNTASGNFNWSEISPTIFGAMFEDTLSIGIRRKGCMHYTSIENIHKVIDPLFLNDLKARLEEIKTFSVSQRTRALKEYQDYLASLKFLDPACGSGNFLTETYICIRKLENEALAILQNDQIILDDFANVKVSINQFYGIEINDFAVSVAMTALWIAESQMFEESQKILHGNKEFLPLTTNVNIHEDNAIQMDWGSVVVPSELNYIMGNPPFSGYAKKDDDKKADYEKVSPFSNVDYVALWYIKAAEFIQNTNIKVSFVSTNSICQGEQATLLWKYLYEKFHITINFAWQSFKWTSEAKDRAAVSVIIVGFSLDNAEKKYLYSSDKVESVDLINQYLLNAPIIFIEERSKPICDVPKGYKGSSAVDGGNLFLSERDYDILMEIDPSASEFIREFKGAKEYLEDIKRYCIWIEDYDPKALVNHTQLMNRIKLTRAFRLSSKKGATVKYAAKPYAFMENRQPKDNYILIPRHTTSARYYIPFGFMDKDVICGDANSLIPNATLYHFGVLQSSTHMAWTRYVCGRLGDEYRYSTNIVYNTFIWCEPSDEQKAKIEKTAQAILDARASYPDCSLADMYGENMYLFANLVEAHEENDKAVWEAYGKAWEFGNESDCVACMMKLYEQKVQEVK